MPASVNPSVAPTGGASPAPPASVPPTAGPSLAPSAGAGEPGTTGGWLEVLPPLTLPAAYLDLGFAGNGDLIVVGTDDLAENPATQWIARYSPDGTLRKRVTVGRKLQASLGRDMVHVDPTDDSVLFTQVDFSTGYYHVYRVASATGKVLADLKLHRAATTVTVTSTGRLFGITPTYGTWTNRRPCIVNRLAADGSIASGVDYWLERCETYAHPTPPAYFLDPLSIEVAADGNLLLLDWGEDGFRFDDEPAGLALTVLTTSFEFVRHFHLPADWQADERYRGLPMQGATLAGDGTGRIYLVQDVRSADQSRGLGFRLGVFDTSGALVAVYGLGGDAPGLAGPISARVDSADGLWVIDFDAAAKTTVLMRR